MKALLQSFRRHPLSVWASIIYFLFACWELQLQISFRANSAKLPHEVMLMQGEGGMYGLFFFYIISIIFIIVIMCYMIARIKQLRYYTAMLLLVLASMDLIALFV